MQHRPSERSRRPWSPDGDREAVPTSWAWLESWLLALLVPLLGPRAAAAWLAALLPRPTHVRLGPYCVTADTAEQFSEAEIRLLIPFLYVIGPGPNRGMPSHARTAPIPHRESARAPP